jgi:hypothetical protein
MTHRRICLALLVSSTIAAPVVFAFTFASTGFACPNSYSRRDGSQSQTNPWQNYGTPRSDRFDPSSTSATRLTDPKNDPPDLTGLAVVASVISLVGLGMAGAVYRERYMRQKAMLPAIALPNPQVDHPEIYLTNLPKEALY